MFYKTGFKIKRELLFEYDPNQQISFFSQGVFPAISSLAEFVGVLYEFKREITEPKKGKPIAATLKVIPLVREFHYWLSVMSKDYAKMLGIKQPKPETLL